ncbi:MAG: DUF4056 domain-containing protein [Sedimentisphaerales bacterium]|nr:DUF4056 domain-containing protein [Sedimentisphaerales bacterium]
MADRRFHAMFFWSRIGLVLFVCFLAGCGGNPPPRLRAGAYFGDFMGMSFPEPGDFGKHSRINPLSEKNGMVYTCKAGFVDLAHLREAADRTVYIATLTEHALLKNKPAFSFRCAEPSRYHVALTYPASWSELSSVPKKELASDLAICLGQYLSHTTTVWHEIITWFGFASSGLFSEHLSAFSWEDTYSDLLGIHLARIAISDREHDFNQAMTELIDHELKRLEIQPSPTAQEAVRIIYERWFEGGLYFWLKLNKRNFDVGLDDGEITPWQVPGLCPDAKAESRPVPTLDFLYRNGFSVRVEIAPQEFEKDQILQVCCPDRACTKIDPVRHFPIILDFIEAQAYQKYGPDVEIPEL